MSHTKRVMIFVAILVVLFVILILTQFFSIRNGVNYPKWPAIVIGIISYYVLLSKKNEN